MQEPELNAPQAEAAAHVRGPLLVFAGAGSGKTRVITYRIANLVAGHRVAPFRVLAVTFTNKAAREMQERLVRLMGEEIARDLWVGTFHATCARLLRRHGRAVGLSSSFSIYDTADQRAVVTRVLKEMGLDDRRYPPRSVLHKILGEKQEGRGPEDMRRDSYMDDAIGDVYVKYNEYLRAANAVDFEDLIGLTVKLLEDDALPESREISGRFQHVLVDEFQDTNGLQYRLLRLLARDHRNLCVVGDDDQSIYRWRGADVRNIRNFANDYPDAHVVKLEQNYRSSANIVAAALGIIAPSSERVPKELWTQNDAGEAVDVIATADERDEAAIVTRLVQGARGEGSDPGSMAVFYRVHAQSRVLEEALRAANVPYQIVGGTKFYERAEIKDALSYLRVLVNPRSDVDLLRILNVPARGIGDTTAQRLVSFATARRACVHDALWVIDEAPDLNSAAKRKLGGVRDLLARLTKHAEHATPREALEEVLAETGYLQALREEKSAEADARLENLAELSSSLDDYAVEAAAAGEAPTLAGFLERVSLVADADDPHGGGRVTLMTVHAAKGLEFDLVLLTGMEDDMFPYRGADGMKSAAEMEEERRLAYVATTRARRKLVMTYARTRHIFGGVRGIGPSRFVQDVPAKVARHAATPAANAVQRFVGGPMFRDEPPRSRPPFRHPQSRPAWGRDEAAPPASAPPQGRWVDRSFFADEAPSFESLEVRKGSRVWHERFGDGEVISVSQGPEPAVVAFFPGWGQRKVLAKYLKFG